MTKFNNVDLARGYGNQSYEDLMNYYSGRYTYESEPQPKPQPKPQPQPRPQSNPLPITDPRRSVPMNNDWGENWGDRFEPSGQPAPSTPVTSNPFTDEDGFEWRSSEEFDAAQGQPVSTGGPAPIDPIETPEIKALREEIAVYEGNIEAAEYNVNKAGETFGKAMKEKLAKEKAYKEALEKCREQGRTLKQLEAALKNPEKVTEQDILNYLRARNEYNTATGKLKIAADGYKTSNEHLIKGLKDLESAKTKLKGLTAEKEALTKEIESIQQRISYREGVNAKIEKASKTELKPEDIFKDAGKKARKASKKGMGKNWKTALWVLGGIVVTGLAAWGISAWCGGGKKDEAPAPAEPTATTPTTETPAKETDVTETDTDHLEKELEEESRQIQEGIDKYKYDPKAAFKVEKGDCLWNAVKAILKNKNGKEPTDAQIQQGVYAFVYENNFEFTDNDGIKGYRPGLQVNQVDLDNHEYQNLVRIKNEVYMKIDGELYKKIDGKLYKKSDLDK